MIFTELSESNYPPFGEIVLLAEKLDEKSIIVGVGQLEVITKDGPQFKVSGDFDPYHFFGFSTKSNFKPTHYAKFTVEFE